MAGREHTLDKGKIHYKWDNSLPPAIEIESGDTVHCETDEVRRIDQAGDARFDSRQSGFRRLYPLAGPIYVKGAQPGDILEVEILRLEPLDWGWAGIIPGLGLLSEDFTEPYIRYFDLTNGLTAAADDIHIPMQPFCGTMGVATDDQARSTCCRPPKARAISTRAISTWARSYSCRSSSRGACSWRATATPRRAMAKSASPASSARWGSACASMS